MYHQAISQCVHELVQQYSEVTGNEYCDCMKLIVQHHPQLASEYLGTARTVRGPSISPKSKLRAAEKVHELTLQYMEEYGIESYEVALKVVLHENRELMLAYVQA